MRGAGFSAVQPGISFLPRLRYHDPLLQVVALFSKELIAIFTHSLHPAENVIIIAIETLHLTVLVFALYHFEH